MALQHVFAHSFDNLAVDLPPQGKIRVGYLRGLTGLVSRLGGDPRSVLEHQDIDPDTFDNPDQDIECITVVNLLEYCSRRLSDPLFGLRLAEQQNPDVYGCAWAFARSAPNVREALRSIVDYVQLSVSPECEMELVSGREISELRWGTHIGVGDRDQVYYHGLLLILKMLRTLESGSFRPSYASMTSRIGGAELQQLQDRLGCRIHTRADTNAIAFPTEVLEKPLATSDRMMYTLLGNCLDRLRATSRAGFVEQVESSVRRALSRGQCSVDNCAEDLGTSARTLQKRLTRMGVKFSVIVQEERIRLAKQALQWSDCSLDEIAFELGYSEQTSFGRAFKRATGMTPKSFRVAERRDRSQL